MFLGFQWMQDNKFLFPDCLGISCLIIKYCKAIESGKAKYLLFLWKQHEMKEGNGV